MKTVQMTLESLRKIESNKKVFFLKLTGDAGKKFRLLGGIFEPNEACKIKHGKINQLIEELEDSTGDHTLLQYITLHAPGIDTTSIALEVLSHVGITKEFYEPMELTVGFPDSYITGFRFSIPRNGVRSAKTEISNLLKWVEENVSSFKRHEVKKEKDSVDLQYQLLVLREEQRAGEEVLV